MGNIAFPAEVNVKGENALEKCTLYEILGGDNSDKQVSLYKSFIVSDFTENEDIPDNTIVFDTNSYLNFWDYRYLYLCTEIAQKMIDRDESFIFNALKARYGQQINKIEIDFIADNSPTTHQLRALASKYLGKKMRLEYF